MSLADYLLALRNHWVGAVALSLVGLCAALAWSLSQPAVYAADANGFVTTGAGAGTDDNVALGSVGDALSKSRAKSYVDVATSRATAQRVIDELDLDASPSGLIGQIEVEQPVDTVLLKITARASSPELAQGLADAWVTALAAEVAEIENPDAVPDAQVPQVRSIESAALPSAPISPRPLRDGALGLLVGILLGVAYAALRSQLDRRLRTTQEVERKFGVSVVGAVPATRGLEHERGEPAELAVAASDETASFAAAEAFRKLRTNLSYMDIDDPPRTIVVTSSQPSDGKSTVSTNLAAAVAASGQPVILVDADLRRPVVAATLGLVEGAGLTDVLIGRVELDDVLQEHPQVPGLFVLAAGGTPPNPSEMLGSRTMRTLLEQMAREHMVVLDAPPLLPVTDAAVLTTIADGALVVVSHGRTLDGELESSLANLAAVKGRVLGVVFNRVPRRNAAGGYYGTYYYQQDDAAGGRRRRHGRGRQGRRRRPE